MPEDKIDTTLDSIMKYNFKENFHGIVQKPRIYASEHDKGLLVGTWPKGGEPRVPFPYAHEVWTGIEYEVAALLIERGKIDSGLKILEAVRDRYDGIQRNPWNEVECGDHYIRAMSSWRVYEAAIGYSWNAVENCIKFLPQISESPMRAFFITNSSWGLIERIYSDNEQIIKIKPFFGTLELKKIITLSLQENNSIVVLDALLNDSDIKDMVEVDCMLNTVEISFKESIKVEVDQELFLKMKQ